MSADLPQRLLVAIACGGTGGHLFPGLAVAQELKRRGCAVKLLISRKDVDLTAVRGWPEDELLALPAVGLVRGGLLAFIGGFRASYRIVRASFQSAPPCATLSMGGFTSAPPLLAARRAGARTCLHESNTIPGRANRWLSWRVDRAFLGFPQARRRLHTKNIVVTGTPVRPQFTPRDPESCRWGLGLDRGKPTILVMGGSQGASGVNQLVIRALPFLAKPELNLQFVHLTGPAECDLVRAAYGQLGLRAVVHPFFHEMELALGAATVAVSRAGASSLAELAAMGIPPVLVPYPAATDNHQFYNARAFEESGAARLLMQSQGEPEVLCKLLLEIVQHQGTRAAMQRSLGAWHKPRAAQEIAEGILEGLEHSAVYGKDSESKRPDPGFRAGENAPPGHPILRSQGKEVAA